MRSIPCDWCDPCCRILLVGESGSLLRSSAASNRLSVAGCLLGSMRWIVDDEATSGSFPEPSAPGYWFLRWFAPWNRKTLYKICHRRAERPICEFDPLVGGACIWQVSIFNVFAGFHASSIGNLVCGYHYWCANCWIRVRMAISTSPHYSNPSNHWKWLFRDANAGKHPKFFFIDLSGRGYSILLLALTFHLGSDVGAEVHHMNWYSNGYRTSWNAFYSNDRIIQRSNKICSFECLDHSKILLLKYSNSSKSWNNIWINLTFWIIQTFDCSNVWIIQKVELFVCLNILDFFEKQQNSIIRIFERTKFDY